MFVLKLPHHMHMAGELKTDFALVHLYTSYSVTLEPYF